MKLSKYVVASTLMLSSVASFAGGPVMAPPPVADSPYVTAPYANGYEFGFDFMFLRPHLSDMDHGAFNVVNGNNIHVHICCVDHECYDFGKRVTLGYHFDHSANDIQLIFMWYSGDDDNCCVAPQTSVINSSEIFVPAAKMDADSEICPYWHIDLRFGQWINVCPSLGLHIFTGIRYADLEHEIKYRTYDANDDLLQTACEKSDFCGIGPQFGADFNYDLSYGFGLLGNVTTSVLYAKDMDNKFTCVTIATGAVENWCHCEHEHLVPAIDMNLGVHYTYSFDDATALDVALSYQTIYYHEVLDRQATRVAANAHVKGSDNTASFGLSGPVLSLKLYLA